jgi:hypothetical protein
MGKCIPLLTEKSVSCPQQPGVRPLPTDGPESVHCLQKRLLSAHKKKGFYLLTTVAHSTAHSGCLTDRDGPRICPQSAGCPQRQTILCRHLPTAHCLPTAAMGCGPGLLTTETVPTPAYKFVQSLLTSVCRPDLLTTDTVPTTNLRHLDLGPSHDSNVLAGRLMRASNRGPTHDRREFPLWEGLLYTHK